MRQKPAKTTNKLFSLSRRTTLMAMVGLVLLAPVSTIIVRAATCGSAADCRQQLNNLQNQNSAAQNQVNALAAQASTYEEAINTLQGQINTITQQITANQAKQADLQQQIVQKQAEIDHERKILASDLKAMYVDDQMSTIEMLATSKNLSDYVDKEEYRTAVQNKIQETMAQIAQLQKELQSQKAEVDNLLVTEQTQQTQLASERAQQAKLLAYNSSQRASYNAQIAANRSSMGALQARLAALNTTSDSRVSMSGTCGGGYPASATNHRGGHWGCNYGKDNTIDNWNMLNRECVSYTSFMVNQYYGGGITGTLTSGWGSAYKWITAASGTYRVDQTPSAGSVAIRDKDWSDPEDVGHAMWVESARSSSDITVMEYNQHMDGRFQERTFNPHNYSEPVYYIHFR